MIARDLISDEIPPLKDSDTGLRALSWMDEFKVAHLPIVRGTEYIGLISDTDILDMEAPEKALRDQKLNLVRPFVTQDVHVYNVMQLVSDLNLSMVPILDNEGKYIGATNLNHLMSLIVKTSSIADKGAVIVLNMNERNYSMVEISRIVEENDARILSSYITSAPDSVILEVTLKINQMDAMRIIKSFERYGYDVTQHHQKSSFVDDINDNYESLMNFLNM